ncbi:head-tail connector protein [Anatilimnocola floriformis]|uniref:head-tail connector protein n=1 Tax=Anatilimnocola floriformis TaxID=2948575 RepID=UPI0020C2FC1A|nr:hypothetical protein [Anatilimnocola floriformis]
MRQRIETIAALPLDFNCLKEHLNIEHDFDDRRIAATAWAAIGHIEDETNRTFAPATYTETLAGFPCKITLDYPPVTTLESITYYDSDNELVTIDTDDLYQVHGTQKSDVYHKTAWPATFNRPDAVTITWNAGETRLPAQIEQAVKLLVAAWNENREAEITGTIATQMGLGLDRVLLKWRVRPYA